MEFEDILKQVGDYGKYQQRLVYFFLIPSTIIFSLICMNTFFMLSEPDHWCTVQEISHLPPDQQKLFSRPYLIDETSTSGDLEVSTRGQSDKEELLPDKCHMYDINYNWIASLYANNQTEKLINATNYANEGQRFNWLNTSEYFYLKNVNVTKCKSWTFDSSDYDETAVTYVSDNSGLILNFILNLSPN